MLNKEKLKYHQQIDDLIHGRLSDSEADAIWNIIAQNPELLDYLADASVAETIVTKENKSRIFKIIPFRPYIFAAVAILVLGVMISLFGLFSTDSKISIKPIDTIDYTTFRSASTEVNNLASVQQAFNLAAQENYEEALVLLREVVSASTSEVEIAEALILSGIIKYNQGSFEDATIIFDSVEKTTQNYPLLREQALWYLYNTHLQKQEFEDALIALQATIEIDGAYTRVAENEKRILKNFLSK